MGKVIIPKFVANWLEECILAGYSLKNALNAYSAEDNVYKWLSNHNNQGLFARVWLDGYELEKEQLYVVAIPDSVRGDVLQLWKNENDKLLIDREKKVRCESKHKLTEREIKYKDKRFWDFAIPVEEFDEND